MKEDRKGKAHLRVLHDKKYFEMKWGRYLVVAASLERPPFRIDGVVVEEDTFLVMSAPPVVKEVKDPLMKIKTRLIETRPERPGSLLVKGESPCRFLAIIYDFNQETICKEEWIEECLARVLRETDRRGFQSIGLPLMGTGYGLVGIDRFVAILKKSLAESPPAGLERIWLITSGRTGVKDLGMIRKLLG
ncbi:MAG: hypothetical protein JRJ29_07995 [Deltaproteobacteria bacterium]|nr:hypothetical protein [Deltaproteobacteria bacterium]